MVRRSVAIVLAVLAVILLVVLINSCRNSQKDDAFRNYAGDVRSLVSAEQDLSNRLFATLSKPGRGDALNVQTQVNAQRVDAEQLVQRAKDASHPGELDTANGWLVTAFEFRADAIGRIANLIPTALGEKGKQAAIDSIAGQMQAFLASDVIYSQRATRSSRPRSSCPISAGSTRAPSAHGWRSWAARLRQRHRDSTGSPSTGSRRSHRARHSPTLA